MRDTHGHIVLPIYEPAEFSPQFHLAQIFAKAGYTPVLFFIKPNYQYYAGQIDILDKSGINFVTIDEANRSHSLIKAAADKEVRRIIKKLKRLPTMEWVHQSIVEILEYQHYKHYFSSLSKKINTIMKKQAPIAVVMAQTVPATPLDFVLSFCSCKKIPRILVPFAVFNREVLLEYALNQRKLHWQKTPLQILIKQMFPHWVTTYKGKRLLRRPVGEILAVERLKLLETRPWIPSSAPVDAIGCDSERSKEWLVDLGLEKERIVVIGSPALDQLGEHLKSCEQIRQELTPQFHLDRKKRLIAVGWPANIFSWIGNKKIAWPDYPALAKAWIRILQDLQENHAVDIAITVHPKTSDDEAIYLKESGFSYIRSEADKLIALCDAFITLNGSSITNLAIACAKPVFLFDCYDTQYSEYKNVEGVSVSDTEEDFLAGLNQCLARRDGLEKIAEKMRINAPCWGMIDGESNQRLLAVVRSVLDMEKT